MPTTLVTGALGQIGSDLVRTLRDQHGPNAVLATDLRETDPSSDGPYEQLDVRDGERLQTLIDQYEVGTVYHLASLLSARGEQAPELAWEVNVNGLRYVLEAARERKLKVFWPSSIAVFGPTTPSTAPQQTVLEPTTMYGVTKVTGELLCQYYATRYGVDVRSLRYPGLISYGAPPGGGTTDYAVEIFYAELEDGEYTCFLSSDTRLPMMYMPDALRATLGLMAAPAEQIRVRTSYNLTAFSFSAAELAAALQQHIPDLRIDYAPDFRQAIADSWPDRVDDSAARTDWNWQPAYDLNAMVDDMLLHLREKLNVPASS